MPRIRIKRTIELTAEVEFTEEMYPECGTPEEAAQFERDAEFGDKIEWFVEASVNAEFDELLVADSNFTGTAAVFTEEITVVE